MTQIEKSTLDQVKEVFGSNLSDAELEFLMRVEKMFKSVLEAKKGFNIVVEILADKLRNIVRGKLDLNDRTNIDAIVFAQRFGDDKDIATLEDSELTQAEEKFARDVIAVIDFVVRNGVGFGLIANVLCHDVMEIFDQGTLDDALSRGFSPKTSGWASYDEASVGDSEELDA